LTEVVIGPDALEQIGSFTGGRALVVADANTWEAAGQRAIEALGSADALTFDQTSGLLAGIAQTERVRAALAPGVTPVAVGSGVITDIVRYAADLSGRDFISVPTAASMDGYASSVAAMQIDGVKVTYPARAPVAILADPAVAAAAPIELTRAGVGDLLGKATARVDWLAAHLLYGEELNVEAADAVLGPLSVAAERAVDVLAGDVEAVAALLKGLIASGQAMAMAGSSRPASGCEHHASHFWDLQAARGSREHASHGLQVGYATRFAMRLQRFAFGGEVGGLRRAVAPDLLGPEARSWLGDPVPPEIVEAVEEKRVYVSRGMVARDWDTVRAALAPELERFSTVERALDLAEIPSSPGWLGVDEAMLRAALRFGNRLRARYTTVDFLEGQGLLGDAIEVAVRG
jgi:glycerol-1-phosphate dehydrogenase [NAD(P)+]